MSKHNIEQCVRESLDVYFRDLDGSNPHDVYEMVMSCVEKPMLEVVLVQAGGNQSLWILLWEGGLSARWPRHW